MSTAIPERNAADEAIRQAHKTSNFGHDSIPSEISVQSAAITAAAMICDAIACAAEAIVHQIRDADDTVATTLVPAIEKGLTDICLARGYEPG